MRDVGPLAALTGLKSLDLWGTQVRDVGPLAALTGLQSLDLCSTLVSDMGPLAALTDLQSLNLRRTQVSDVASRNYKTRCPSAVFATERLRSGLAILGASSDCLSTQVQPVEVGFSSRRFGEAGHSMAELSAVRPHGMPGCVLLIGMAHF